MVLGRFQNCLHSYTNVSFNAWVRCVVWNFKLYLAWDSLGSPARYFAIILKESLLIQRRY